jgi:acetyl-CoA acetyltransferase
MTEGALAVQACRRAIADSGLDPTEIDGISMFPYRATPPNPFSGPDIPFVQRALGLQRLRWWMSTTGDHGQLGAVIATVDALEAGRAKHVVCYRAHRRQQRRYLAGGDDPTRVFDEDEHTMPYGGGGGAARGALWAARYMAVHKISQEELAQVNLNARFYAATNPVAYWRTPTTLEEYLDSRWICPPLKILDCDYPIDGATAIVLSRTDSADGCRSQVYVESTGCGPGPGGTWLTWGEKSELAAGAAAAEMWSRTRLTPSDVDVAEMYDGFSFFTLQWLEALGLAPPGKAGAWMADGAGRPESEIGISTDGGQLGVGRLHGFGKLAQAARQLRGDAPNQRPDASVAVASASGGPNCACVLLTKERIR